jgi:hypothetical protein
MSRHQFGGSLADFVVVAGDPATVGDIDGFQTVLAPDTDVTFWTAQTAGTQYTDLLDLTGTPITSAATDSTGALPQLQGPDTDPEIWVMWADASEGAGPRRLIVSTDAGASIAALASALADVTEDVTSLATLASTSLGVVVYDSGSSSWPDRPSDSRVYMWVGPTAPAVGGTGMVDGKDFWLNPVPAS